MYRIVEYVRSIEKPTKHCYVRIKWNTYGSIVICRRNELREEGLTYGRNELRTDELTYWKIELRTESYARKKFHTGVMYGEVVEDEGFTYIQLCREALSYVRTHWYVRIKWNDVRKHYYMQEKWVTYGRSQEYFISSIKLTCPRNRISILQNTYIILGVETLAEKKKWGS